MRIHPRSRPIGIAFCFALGLLTSTSALGQSASTSSNSAARYVPKDKPVLYLEFDGLDAHADGWKKTAASKILNDTPTGAMLEDLGAQLLGKLPMRGMTGPESVAMIKHLAKAGFVVAIGSEPNKLDSNYVVCVFRDGFKNKAITPTFAKVFQSFNFPGTKTKPEMKAGHRVNSGTIGPNATQPFSWWVEESKKADLVFLTGGPNAAVPIIETIDGKRPSMLEHPHYKAITQAEPGFEQVGMLFVDSYAFQFPMIPPALGLTEIKRVDARWGFSDNALMSITRIAAPSPRKGILAMMDGPSFDKSSLPPLHEALTGFQVVAFDAKQALTQLGDVLKAVYPSGEQQMNQVIDGVKAKTKLRLKEDILSHVGPRGAFFVMPDKVGSAPKLETPTMYMRMMGLASIPKAAILIDIDTPAAFGKVLDELMTTFNREMKAQAKAAGGDTGSNRNASKGKNPSTFSFSQVTAEPKTYVLNIPQEQAAMFGANFKPAIRVGPKQVAIAINAETARLALETKMTWVPPTSLAAAFQALPSKLKYLNVSDPKDTTPAILAALPGKLQAAINQVMLAMKPPVPGAVAAAPAPESKPSGPPRPMSAPMVGGSGVPAPGPGVGAANGPGKPASGPTEGMIVLQVDPSKLPSADSIKALLFPSIFAVEANDEGIKFISRQAFFEIPDPAGFGAGFQMGQGMFKNGKFDPSGMIPGTPGATPGAPGAPAIPGATTVTPGSKGPGVSAGRPD